ncbi:DUF3852 family protein [Aminipila sp.]|uniref:DUF3852 family protein n=1 Tax=Aminipila sp. TaxID=2060095 RepID=UPI002F3E3DEE
MESRIHREVYVRFGGECLKTYRSNTARRWVLSLHRKHGQFEWAAPAILFACLVFTLTAPLYIWTILAM